MGAMIVYFKGERESRYIPDVTHKEFLAAERSLKFGEAMFIRHHRIGERLRVHVIGEGDVIKNVSSLTFVPYRDEVQVIQP